MKRVMKKAIALILSVMMICTPAVYTDGVDGVLSDIFSLFRMPVYADDNWYQDYTYDLDDTAHTITLNKYNGTASDVVVPAKAVDRPEAVELRQNQTKNKISRRKMKRYHR